MSLQVVMATIMMSGQEVPQPTSAGALNVTAMTTFYGAKDKCPPGGSVAFPQLREEAGGLGTWEDPITCAAARSALDPGARLYVPGLLKYFVVEDDCEACERSWKEGGRYHVDLWLGGTEVLPGAGLVECVNALAKKKATVMLRPPKDLPVDTTPLYDAAREGFRGCAVPTDRCFDVSPSCGVSCETSFAATCADWANRLQLNQTRFQILNKHLDCSRVVAAGSDVCMGGTCGN